MVGKEVNSKTMKLCRLLCLCMLITIYCSSCIKNEVPNLLKNNHPLAAAKYDFSDVDMCIDYYPKGAIPRAAVIKSRLWPTGTELKVQFMDHVSKNVEKKVEQYANEWSKYANIKFKFTKTWPAQIRISFKVKGRSYAAVGTDAKDFQTFEPTMNLGWLNDSTPAWKFKATVLHEFGHVLGLIHEHQNPRAHIPWDTAAVYAFFSGPPNNWDVDGINENIFEKYAKKQTNSSEYDPESIMHYFIAKELTTNGYHVNFNTELSPTDKKFIASQYPKR